MMSRCINPFFYLTQQAASNVSQLTLGNVIPSTSGKYSCEVTADFPSFHSGMASGDLEIVGKFTKSNMF